MLAVKNALRNAETFPVASCRVGHTGGDVVETDKAAVHRWNLFLEDHVNSGRVIDSVDGECVIVLHQVL